MLGATPRPMQSYECKTGIDSNMNDETRNFVRCKRSWTTSTKTWAATSRATTTTMARIKLHTVDSQAEKTEQKENNMGQGK